MTCRCAPALVALRGEFDTVWPARDRSSDGCCGDKAHAARKSDHNPDAKGYAHALDIDEDLAPGLDLGWLWRQWIKRPDPRIRYLIYERRIFHAGTRNVLAYTGANAHAHHLHVSIRGDATFDTSPWGIAPTTPAEAMMRFPNAVHACRCPTGGVWVLGSDGGVGAYGDAPYHGSYPGLPPEGRLGVRAFLAIEPNDRGGYDLLADDGALYGFPV